MGCDIHIIREGNRNGQWVCLETFDDTKQPSSSSYEGRSYDTFGALAAGVRGRHHAYSMPARGVPEDAAPETQAYCDDWDVDGHTHSWLMLDELRALRAVVQIKGPEHVAHNLTEIIQGVENVCGFCDDMRIVFWFDN